jgi:hypothetical protein
VTVATRKAPLRGKVSIHNWIRDQIQGCKIGRDCQDKDRVAGRARKWHKIGQATIGIVVHRLPTECVLLPENKQKIIEKITENTLKLHLLVPSGSQNDLRLRDCVVPQVSVQYPGQGDS